MRAGYLVVAFAILLAAGIGGLAGRIREVDPGPGPIAVALGLDDADAPDLDRRRAQAVADATTACMATRGLTFEATAAPPPAIPDASLGPLDWAARWGFGVSTSVDGPDAAPEADPAAAWLASLPPTERSRIERDLYGHGTVPGCQSLASDAIYGLRTRALAPIAADLARLDAAIEADAGMVDARGRWRDCVAALATELRAPAPALDRSTIVERLLTHFAERTDAVRSDPVRLHALQTTERQVALTVARCEATFERDRARVAAPHEATFVAGHRDELARIASVIATAEAAYPTVPP